MKTKTKRMFNQSVYGTPEFDQRRKIRELARTRRAQQDKLCDLEAERRKDLAVLAEMDEVILHERNVLRAIRRVK